jgi:hypothetical protein
MSPALATFFKAARYDQKRDDAVLLLQTIARHAGALPISAS